MHQFKGAQTVDMAGALIACQKKLEMASILPGDATARIALIDAVDSFITMFPSKAQTLSGNIMASQAFRMMDEDRRRELSGILQRGLDSRPSYAVFGL